MLQEQFRPLPQCFQSFPTEKMIISLSRVNIQDVSKCRLLHYCCMGDSVTILTILIDEYSYVDFKLKIKHLFKQSRNSQEISLVM